MKSEFSNLKKKIFLEVVIIVGVAVCAGLLVLVLFVDGIFEEPFAEGFVHIYQSLTGAGYYDAAKVYEMLFRNNKGTLISIGFCLILLAVFYFALSRFGKYFKSINSGIDKILEEHDREIRLPQELDFMAEKMNSAKRTLRKRELEAQESERRKNELVVYLAHDIRTPLTSVIGYLSLLHEAPELPAELREKYIDIALNKSCNLEKLVGELFEITRYNSEEVTLEKSELNLSMLMMQMADEFYPQMAAKGSEAITEIEENIFLYADADKLARAFGNILKNAASYSPEGAKVTVRAYRQEELAVVEFSNPGKEIPEGKLEKIFEKFYRADESRTGSAGNAGLGLAIAREIIVSHGGAISAKSGSGETIFTVKLPLSQV